MIDFNFSKLCTGCKLCGDVCPTNAISFVEDVDGFVIPHVNIDYCIKCRKCENKCPVLSNFKIESQTHNCFYLYHLNEEIRHIGSSGSAFYSLAALTIKNGGVVYGAEIDNHLVVKHSRVEKAQDIFRLMKSKYIQSDTNGIYTSVLMDLKEGREVLFVGTPCQCSGLNNLIPLNMRSKLLLVDFICHGVPSQSLFDKAINNFEKSNNCKVVNFSFREKSTKSIRNYKITYIQSNGKTIEKNDNPYLFPFYYGYLNHWFLRSSCYKCQFRHLDRPSDLTIGDFWGLDRMQFEINDFEKGYSMIVSNSEKGLNVLSNINDCFVKEIPNGVSFSMERNFAYVHSETIPLIRHFFFKHLSKNGWSFCESMFLQMNPPLYSKIYLGLIFQIDKFRKKIKQYGKNYWLYNWCI